MMRSYYAYSSLLHVFALQLVNEIREVIYTTSKLCMIAK